MPNLFVGTSDCAWEADTDVLPLYKKRQATLQSLETFLSTLLKEKIVEEKAKQMKEIPKLLQTFHLLKSLPPGPNKAAEEERIAYATFMLTFMKNMQRAIKQLQAELQKMFRQFAKK